MRILLLACWLTSAVGCATRTVYLAGDERIYHVQAGEPAPITGWLMSDQTLAELHDALEEELVTGQAPSTSPDPHPSPTAEPARTNDDRAD